MVVVESSEGAGPCNFVELSTGRLDQIRSIVPELDKKCSTTLSRAGCRGQKLHHPITLWCWVTGFLACLGCCIKPAFHV